MFQLYVVCLCCSISHGFLLENSPTVSGGLSESNFITVMKLVLDEKQKRQNLEAAVTSLYQDYKNLNQSYSTLQRDHQKLLSEYKQLRDATEVLNKSQADLGKRYSSLQLEYNDMMQELFTVKSNITELTTFMEKLKNLKSINQLQEVQQLETRTGNIEQNFQVINSKISAIKLNQRARDEDILSLYNLTLATKSDLKDQGVNIGNEILGLKSSIDTNKNQTANLGVQIHSLDKSQQTIRIDNRRRMTSCGGGNVTKDAIIPFPTVKTSVGIVHKSQFISTGSFRCSIPGIYVLVVTLTSGTYNAGFYVYKNENRVFNGFVAKHPGQPTDSLRNNDYEHTGTITALLNLVLDDKITVRSADNVFLSSWNSCVTIFRI